MTGFYHWVYKIFGMIIQLSAQICNGVKPYYQASAPDFDYGIVLKNAGIVQENAPKGG
jgi:hypothetical protein